MNVVSNEVVSNEWSQMNWSQLSVHPTGHKAARMSRRIAVEQRRY